MTISANHLAPQGGGFESQRAFDFEVIISGLSEAVKLAVDSYFIPSMTNAQINVSYAAEDRKIAGRVSTNGGSLVVKDMVDEPIAQALEDWRKKVYNAETGAIGFARDYKKQGTLRLLAPDGSSARSYRLEGLWPTSLSGSNLAMSNNGVVTLTLQLVFDRYFYLG